MQEKGMQEMKKKKGQASFQFTNVAPFAPWRETDQNFTPRRNVRNGKRRKIRMTECYKSGTHRGCLKGYPFQSHKSASGNI